nr:putative late blight resistance protein homolog R1B-17 [Ipomoea batatas]
MPSGIADLIHLRYLALSTIGSVYKFRFSKLQNLQTLVVSSWMGGCYLQLPSNILDLLQLRHLHLEKRYSQCFPSLIQENLQTLYWLKVASSDQNKNFKMFPQLKELGIYIEGELVHGCLESLVHLHLLEKLKVEIRRVEHFYLPTSFPLNLKQLTLRYTYVPWKEIHIVGKLPNLETLKLKDFAFCGSKWEQTEMGFKKLKVLLISRLDFTRWNAKSCYSSLVNSAHDIERRKWKNRRAFFVVNDLGTKVELPNNDCSEENSVEFPNNEGTEGGSVQLPEKKVLKSLSEEGKF